ncbi:MAG TPA: hypothetical protein VGL03_11955 [Thermoanaerobaculia bacterium]|jgi:hypothetical protein
MRRRWPLAFASAVLLFAVGAARGQAAEPRARSLVHPLQEGFVDANGVLLYYKTLGAARRCSSSMAVPGPPTITCFPTWRERENCRLSIVDCRLEKSFR